ncbi:hypothetical protein FO131_19575 [Salmonella bongori]|uniref:hypothetical protein n=1 Tax=Salmonella bongori TaxID=54736 RepID=UPI0012703654|nr:hypothetical protein [Salmonella bongori]ECG8260378.1 hypothetical protein [Salmonella bongori serovar 48:i:-]ECG9254708.1 hypothetical protein [Salmonella bongori]EDP8708174.1 hypothetical protein [Salmonella bongori]EDP8725794.1 hypothetical protein [Salmonella bongori]EEO9371550.1 hypothetical protein [Salmonella bongori]
MKISRTMNLIVPVDTDLGKGYIHSAPISKEVYREHFFVLSKTYSAIFSEGLGVVVGPRIAYLMLEKVAKELRIWDGVEGVRNTLVNEIIRLSSLVYPVEDRGWDNQPLDVAISKGIVDPDEVLGELVFFTCVCAINKPNQVEGLMNTVHGFWNSATTSLDIMAWTASLPTSTPVGSSGATESTSSATSSTTAQDKVSANFSSIPV